MPNGDNVKSWADISKNFDPMMPADLYDGLRLKYFDSFVAPKIKQGASREATWGKFKELTERDPLLSAGGKAMVHAQLGLTSAATAMLDPLKSLSPGAKQAFDQLTRKELQLTKLGEREGMNTTVSRAAGAFAGQTVDFAVLSAALGPEAAFLAKEATSSAKGAELLTRVLRGGLSFGAYDALSADGKDNRIMAGLKGFAVGASLDLGLGMPGYLKHVGATDAVKGDLDKAIAEVTSGVTKNPELDSALAKKAVHDSEVSRLELRPERGHWSYTTGQRGARVYVKDVAGQVTPIDIRPGREYEVYRQARSLVEQGGSVSHYEVHPDDSRTLNEFIRIQTAAEEAKYRGTVIRTPSGQAEEVAKTAKAEGIPAQAVSKNTVELATVQLEHPVLNKPTEAANARVPQEPPKPEVVKETLDKLNLDNKTRNFLERQVERIWDPSVDFEDKRASIVIAARYVKELLPDQYRAKIGNKNPMELLHALKYRAKVGEPTEEVSEIEKVRQETIEQTEKYGKPKVTKEFDFKDKVPASERKTYRNARAGIRAGGETHGSLADAIDASGDSRFLGNPAGRKSVESQLSEASLKGERILGSIEGIDQHDLAKSAMVLIKKGYKVIPIKGYTSGTYELMYFKAEDIGRVAPLLDDYDQFVSKQAGRVWDTDGKPTRDIGDEAHKRLGKAFGVPEKEIGSWISSKERLVAGTRIAPEIARKPYGSRLVLQQEDMDRLWPRAEGMAMPAFEEYARSLGIELPPSLKGGEPLMILTPESDKEVIFHERLHLNGMHAGTYDEFPTHVSEGTRQTALELSNGLVKAFSGYKELSQASRIEEAFTHAATAVRFGNQGFLEELARWDRSVPHVLEFVHNTAENLLERSYRSLDSVPVRIYQRTLTDLMRRASGEVSEAMVKGSRATGSGIGAWYDAVKERWILRENGVAQKEFADINELWDHLNSNDKNFMAPSMSLRSELGGVRGPFVPTGSEPNGAPLPVPEIPPEGRFAGMSAASALWRPFFPWLATVHENMNALFRRSGKYMPIYESAKEIDNQFRAGDKWLQDNYEKVADLLAPFKGKKMQSVFNYLTHPEVERTTKLMEKYGLSQAEAINAHKIWEYMLGFRNDTQLNVIQYMNEFHPKLRGFSWAPDRVFGPMGRPQDAGVFDKLIRHEGKWDPQDAHIGRFLSVMLREGMEKKFTGKSLSEFEKLINTQTPDGNYVIPNSVRWPMTNYTKYMRGIPDTSQQVINRVMSDFFSKVNERFKSINKTLPTNFQLPTLEAPPRQVLNRFMLMSYAMGLGGRVAITVRDGMQAFTGGLTVLGPTRFTRAFTRFMSSPQVAFDRADRAGALLRKNNIGELYGDIMGEIPTEGPGWVDRITKWSNALMAPSRWGHNFGRAVMFDGEYHDAVEAIQSYRAGKQTVDQLLENTSIWFMDRPAQTSLLREISNPRIPAEDVATKVALEAVDLTQWPYRRGTQPTLLRYGAGRIFGQYGVWPANYADFLYRIGRKWAERPSMAARTSATWAAVNYALSASMNAVGADTSRWFWQSPAGFAGSPHWELVQALMIAPENTDEGHQARKKIMEYPLNFVPAMGEMRAVMKAIQEGGGNSWPPDQSGLLRVLGFRPIDDTQKDQEWDDFVKTQLGYENTRRRR